MSVTTNIFKILIEKPKNNIPLWRRRHVRKASIKIVPKQLNVTVLDYSGQGIMADSCEYGDEIPGFLN